jgi:hypothetical protein
MMALEEQFEITLDEEGAEKITTVQEAADLIQVRRARPRTARLPSAASHLFACC